MSRLTPFPRMASGGGLQVETLYAISTLGTAIRRLSSCSTEMVILRQPGGPVRWYGAGARQITNIDLDGLEPQGRRIELPDREWDWAYPLRSMTEVLGCIVVSADDEPGSDEQMLVHALVQQAGAAIGIARTLADQRHAADRLQGKVEQLEQQTQTMRLFAELAAEPDTGRLASALQRLTDLPVSVEDQFGHRLSWATPRGEQPPALSTQRRTALLATARRVPGPARSGSFWGSTPRSRQDPGALLVLHDRRGQATEADLFALDRKSTV